MRILSAFVVTFAILGNDARTQWGFEGWGFWGWGAATPESAELHGAAEYAMGAGMYNLSTAIAASIDTDTAIRFNEYVYQATREAARLYAARRDQRIAKNRSLYDARQRQLRESPTARDVELGDALNAAVADLSDPRIGRSSVRAVKAHVPASLIAEVPFLKAAERVTFMLDDLRSAVKWPEVFEDPRFANDQKTFDDLLTRLREEAYGGDLSDATLRDARGFVKDLRGRLETQPLKDPGDQKEAMRFVTSAGSLLGLLDKADIRPAILELRKVQDTTIGNLLGFMNVYNLRFGPATTPKARQVYIQLYEILDKTRDQILAEAAIERTPLTERKVSDAESFYQLLDDAARARVQAPAKP
jgi:hypothetical protein